MVKMKQFRLDPDTINKILAIQEFMKSAYEVQSENLNMPKVNISQTDAVKYSIKHLYDHLKSEGYKL